MAAIDKLYVKSYYEYDDLLRWSLIYYPRLIEHFYNIHLSHSDFMDSVKRFVKDTRNEIEKEYTKFGGRGVSFDDAVDNLMEYYHKTAEYDAPRKSCEDEVRDVFEMDAKTDDELKEMYSYPCTSTPFSVDKRLKWICPIPFVREYLHKQCGVNPKYEWFYRLFFKGKSFA